MHSFKFIIIKKKIFKDTQHITHISLIKLTLILLITMMFSSISLSHEHSIIDFVNFSQIRNTIYHNNIIHNI